MSEKAKTVVGEVIPRWATVIILGICALFLKAEMDDNKQTRAVVSKHSGEIEMLKKSESIQHRNNVEMLNAVKNLSELNRLLDLRLTRMEAGNDARKL